MHTLVSRVPDFEVTGDGSDPAWSRTNWLPLAHVGGESTDSTRAKTLCSDKGVYFLVECEDKKLSCGNRKDNDDIYQDDVIEVFLWPDESQDLYFEYELSPLNIELPILVPNHRRVFHGWLPWHYTGERRVRHATSVRGGPKEPGAKVTGWTVEFFIPFVLFAGMGNVPATPGTKWRANIYRIDYDDRPKLSHWAWCPDTGTGFHDFKKFGVFEFG
jgi:hypothetical protein